MAQILVSTTGTLNPVPIDDLGAVEIPHPTTDLVLFDTDPNLTPFVLEEIRDSSDLQAQLDAGHLTMKFDSGIAITNVAQAAAQLDTIMGSTNVRAGKVLAGAFSGSPKEATVTFVVPFADANYAVIPIPHTSNTTDKYVVTVDDSTKTAGQFTISISSNSTTNLVAVHWVATKHTE